MHVFTIGAIASIPPTHTHIHCIDMLPIYLLRLWQITEEIPFGSDQDRPRGRCDCRGSAGPLPEAGQCRAAREVEQQQHDRGLGASERDAGCDVCIARQNTVTHTHRDASADRSAPIEITVRMPLSINRLLRFN